MELVSEVTADIKLGSLLQRVMGKDPSITLVGTGREVLSYSLQ